jgi:hypothetical protein
VTPQERQLRAAQRYGGWTVRPLGDGAIVDTGDVQFARAFRGHAVNMSTAEASLIAAAPSMRDALEQVRDLASQTLDARADQINDSVVLAAILAIAEKGLGDEDR